MRSFLILCCLAVAAHAASLGGYDYERHTEVQSGFDNLSGPHIGGSSHVDAAPVEHTQSVVAPAEYTKEFYTYAAPEGEFDHGEGVSQLSESLKHNLRVIFIRGPESNGLENAVLNLAKSASDDRTAIYVLSKQADVSDLANKLNQLNNHNGNQPEVHFVKYRTPADADNAQRTIQSQYDSLPGHSSDFDGGVAPVLDFASKAPAAVIASDPNSSYLPPNRRV